MKKILATLSLIALLTPLSASAATVRDVEVQIQNLLGQLTALSAAATHAPVVCGLLASESTVKAGESFELIWSTFGAQALSPANPGVFPQQGIETIVQDKPGIFKYDMTFYGQSGAQTTCSAKITVTS